MKNIKTNLLLLITALIFFTSCDPEKLPDNIEQEDLTELFTLLKSSPQSFSGQAGSYWSITGNKGTVIHFNPNSFEDANGNVVSSGTVNIELVETPKAKDMILNQTVTMVGQDRLLESGGSFNIKATQNGQELQAGRYGAEFQQDQASTNDMSIFTGTTDAAGNTTWNDDATNTQQGTVIDSSNARSFFNFDSLSAFNWINCDRFASATGPTTNIKILLDGHSVKFGGAAVFVIFPDINAVTPTYALEITKPNEITLGDFYRIPIGMKADYVALAKDGNNYYMAKQQGGTITNDHSFTMTLEKKTAEEIKTEISNL